MLTALLRRTTFAALLLPALAAPAAAAEFIAMNGQVWPPYYLADGKQPGFAREVLQVCIHQAGYELRTSPLTIDKMYDGLRLGYLDAHVMSYDPKREAYLIYGKVPLFSDAYRPVVRAGSGTQIKGLADFDPLKLGHLRGLRYSDAFHAYVQKRIDAGNIVQVDSNDELLRQLLRGSIDVYVNLAGTSRWLAKQMGALDKIVVLPYDVKKSDYFLAVSQKGTHIRDKKAFLQGFDECLRQMERDGRLGKLRARYGLE